MKQQLSALMDGELFDDEAEALLNKLKRNPEAHEEWRVYHLVGDVLRQPDQAYPGISATMHERLQAEPTIFAPRSRANRNARWFALSAAASVMALALVAWMSVQVGSEPAPQMAMQQQSAMLRPASFTVQKGMNDYLMAHQEFSPSADVQGAASYIRTVAEQ
ncbi:MAG: sigma-E factor negative regulatory protein [Gallionellaceae bacterium]|nr:sigma-E factor negative regulatory protein [Gallionellaceae bacterium]